MCGFTKNSPLIVIKHLLTLLCFNAFKQSFNSNEQNCKTKTKIYTTN